jgi:hypothetical protein
MPWTRAWSFGMPRVIVARSRYRAGGCRVGSGRCRSGFAYPGATITMTLSPFLQVGFPLSGMLIGQSQRIQGAKRTAAKSRRTQNERRCSLVNKLHLTSQRGREPQVQASLRIGFEDVPQFTGAKREFRVYSLTRFPSVADYECTEAPILRRLSEPTRGLIPCP